MSTGQLRELRERRKGKKFKVPRIIYVAPSLFLLFLLELFIPHLFFSLLFLDFLPPSLVPSNCLKPQANPIRPLYLRGFRTMYGLFPPNRSYT